MRRLRKSRCILSGARVVLFGSLVWLGLAAGMAWAQPAAGNFTFTTGNYRVSERESSVTIPLTLDPSVAPSVRGALITVTRTNAASGRVFVDYATANGSALAGSDYISKSGTLVFDDFQMSASFVVQIIDTFGPAP